LLTTLSTKKEITKCEKQRLIKSSQVVILPPSFSLKKSQFLQKEKKNIWYESQQGKALSLSAVCLRFSLAIPFGSLHLDVKLVSFATNKALKTGPFCYQIN